MATHQLATHQLATHQLATHLMAIYQMAEYRRRNSKNNRDPSLIWQQTSRSVDQVAPSPPN
jgi:hypothetical protein